MRYTKDSVKTYTFGKIEFSVRNYRGVYFLSDEIKAKIHNLSPIELVVTNKEAWKQANRELRTANRHSNWSQSGNISIYEDASSHYDVAKQVAKESWKKMQGWV